MQNDLQPSIGTTAFAFRGYNLTNLGRTAELLAHASYGPVVLRHLRDAERVVRRSDGAASRPRETGRAS